MTPNQLIPTLESHISSNLRGAADLTGRQGVTTWLECLKFIMLSHGLRDASDWNLAVDTNCVAAGGDLVAAGGTVYGALWDYIYDVSTDNLIVTIGNVNTTITTTTDVGALAEASGAEIGAAILHVLPNAVNGTTPQFFGALYPQGLVFTQSLFTAAIGDETAVVTANDVRCAIVYRVTEARVS